MMEQKVREFRGDVAWDALAVAGITISDELAYCFLFKKGLVHCLRIKTLHGFEIDVEIKTIDVLAKLIEM